MLTKDIQEQICSLGGFDCNALALSSLKPFSSSLFFSSPKNINYFYTLLYFGSLDMNGSPITLLKNN